MSKETEISCWGCGHPTDHYPTCCMVTCGLWKSQPDGFYETDNQNKNQTKENK